MDKHRLLIIEDDEALREQMRWALAGDFDVMTAGSPEEALEAIRASSAALMTLDLGLPPDALDPEAGLRLLGRILQQNPLAKVVVMTGNTERAWAIKAISQGAHDFLVKPVEIDELKIILRRALYVHSLESDQARSQGVAAGAALESVLGVSAKMQEVFATVRKVAATDVPVLVTGESGTGKELIARAIHALGLRRGRPFIPINCGAIPDALLESELFGHEKGAFTGAHVLRSGRIELAQGGTLFLDEIAELPLQLQVKVLRFLQDHQLERVGGRESLNMDVRVIAATNKCVGRLISDERFREDLYYRLAVVTIELPPLRERGDDMVLLARAFLQKYAPERGKPKTMAREAVEAICRHEWPGNVRELENKIRRAIAFSDGPVVRPPDLGFAEMDDGPRLLDLKRAKEDLEVRFVQKAIVKHNGNISKAAEELGLSRPTVHQLIKKHNMLDSLRKG